MLSQEQKKKRETILGITGTKYPIGGTEKFGGLSYERIERLISEGFLTIREHETYTRFIKFMKSHPTFRAYGYAVSSERSDSRIVIQGIESLFVKVDEKTIQDFKNTFYDADKLTAENNRYICFYDYEKVLQ